jgi:hypothetical protein
MTGGGSGSLEFFIFIISWLSFAEQHTATKTIFSKSMAFA